LGIFDVLCKTINYMIMKRILLFAVLLFATLSLIGQNVWKYPVYANGGIVVGAGQNITTPSIVLGSTAITATAAQLNVVYGDRLKWNGGSTGLVAATGRSSLGGTTVGQALFTLTNPSAITFLRVNADNTVTALSAANFRTATATVGTADTLAMLSNYINKSDTAAMLSKYLLISDTVGLGGSTSGIQASDTSLMLDPYITDIEARKAINDSLTARLNGATELSDVASMLADIKPYFVFGAGAGAEADSTLFAKGDKSFGSFRVIEDSLYVHSLTNLYMTSGDSLRFNVYYGNGMTRVATDSLFTAPQGVGSHFATLTPNKVRTINHGNDVWIGIIGPQPVGKRPKEWVFQLNAKIVRD
jgi:hypothetical protein